MVYRFALLFLFFTNCSVPSSTQADRIIQNSIRFYQTDRLQNNTVQFQFRQHHYQLDRNLNGVVMYRILEQETGRLVDKVENFKTFSRTLNNVQEVVSDSMSRVYTNSINSVFYFFQLPLTLLDPAAIKSLEGSEIIKGKPYDRIKVVFKEEGGGDDFSDEYRYWIHQKLYRMDFLAYNYQTDGGGTRFRKAIDQRRVDGVLFQDYENYKPQKRFVALDSLPFLFAQGQLLKVSEIKNENIRFIP